MPAASPFPAIPPDWNESLFVVDMVGQMTNRLRRKNGFGARTRTMSEQEVRPMQMNMKSARKRSFIYQTGISTARRLSVIGLAAVSSRFQQALFMCIRVRVHDWLARSTRSGDSRSPQFYFTFLQYPLLRISSFPVRTSVVFST